MSEYKFEQAQKHELDWQKKYIEDVLPEEYDRWLERKIQGKPDSVLRAWFETDAVNEFDKHIAKYNTVLEIGCGSVPGIREMFDCHRVVIDPLAGEYDMHQEKLWGGSFFDDMSVIAEPAEKYMGLDVYGAIVCRNTIDHAEDPLTILDNISMYAMPGCYLFFWSDIWHKRTPDPGHHNITKSRWAMRALLYGLGFKLVESVKSQHDTDNFIEFGGIYIKE